MAEVNYNNGLNYTDYHAHKFFANAGIENAKFSSKEVKLKESDETLKVIHIEGVAPDGAIINFDIFPYYDYKEGDLAKFPESINDFVFRLGYTTVYDTETKKNVVKTSNPYWTTLNQNTDAYKYSGEKRERKYAFLRD